MINIYEIGANDYLGEIRQIADNEGAPVGFTRTAPPTIPSGKYAKWQGSQWSIVDEPYTAPDMPAPPAPEPLTWANAPAEYFHIDVGPFFDRFGIKAIAVASSTDPLVDGMFKLTTPRKYIDLKRTDVSYFIGLLVTKEILTEAERATVLKLETTEYERSTKGLPQPVA